MSGGSPRPGWFAKLFGPPRFRCNLVDLCRRTTLEGWDELQAAAAAGRGVALVAAAGDLWPVAACALGGWAGPLHLVLPAAERDDWLNRLLSTGGESPLLAAGPDAVAKAFAAGEKVLFVVEDGSPEPLPPASPEDVPILAVAVERPRRGRYRVIIRRRPSPAG